MGKIIVIALIVFLFTIIVASMKHQADVNGQIKNECEPTELYVIGNKGMKTRVYDCSGVTLRD